MVKIQRIFVFLLFLGICSSMQAQDKGNPITFNAGADFMSRYVWRGTQYGGVAPSIQPSVSMGIAGLEIGAWGAFSTGGVNTTQEFDLYLSYTFAKDMFTATVTDYYFPVEGSDYKYFCYDKDKTGHVFEGSLSFNGTEKLPISLLLAVNFYGADAARIIDDPKSSEFNQKDGIQYSTYAELGYSTAVEDVSLDFFLGMNLLAPKKADTQTGYVGESGFYGKYMGVVNLGLTASKEIKITEHFSLPIQASLITNPMDEKVFFVFGFSL